ncbi:MAG: methyl-accepting chemotaxis protein, partial [Synergistaceae bacterium]
MDNTKKRIKASTIMICCTVMTFALVVMGIVGALECINQFKNVTKTVSSVTLFRNSMRKLTVLTYEQRNRVQLYAVTLDRRYYDQWKAVQRQSERDAVIKEMRVLGLTPSEERLMDEITVLKARITKRQEEALSVEERTNSDIITSNGKILDQISYDLVTREIGQMLIRTDYTEDGEKLLELIETLQNTIIGRAIKEISKEQADMNRFLLMQMAILGALLIMVIAVYFIMRKKIIVPMQKVEKHFGQISNGDLHTKIALDEDTSEVGQLVKAANIMQSKFSAYIKELEYILSELSKGNLNQHVSDNFTGDFVKIRDSLRLIISSYKESFAEINNAAYEVSNGSEQIAMSSQSLSEGATEQAGTIEELTANVNEVTTRVNETAENAEKVKQSAV